MAERSDLELIAELRDLGRWLETPAPDVTQAVRARLAGQHRPRFASPLSVVPRRWLAAAAAVVVALAIALVPQGRAAVAHAVTGLLHFAGVEVSNEPPHLAATPSPLPSMRSAGLDEARRRARFPVGVPEQLGVPPEVQLADPGPDGAPRVVSLLYRSGTLRVDEFDGTVDPAFLKSNMPADATWVQVAGDTGIWFPSPHGVTYIDRRGVMHNETARLAGPTLIWIKGVVTYRLEGVPTLPEALAIATSVH